MNKSRIEAFTDGVMAIIITIMVLELHPPASEQLLSFMTFGMELLVYLISFIYVGIYWMNHHHLFQTVTKIKGNILLANLSLLFFLSLIPIATKWLSEDFISLSLAFYGVVLLLCSLTYAVLVKIIISSDNLITKQIYQQHRMKKELVSTFLYAIGILSAFFTPLLSMFFYIGVAMIWIVPDYRIEHQIETLCQKSDET